MPRPKNKKLTATVRKRKDCNRWEVILRDPHFGRLHGGLFKSEDEARKFLTSGVGLRMNTDRTKTLRDLASWDQELGI